MSNSKSVILCRQRRKENLVQVSGGKCQLCGYNKCIAALEFHHIDPSKKSYSIGTAGNCHSIESNLDEIKKCVLVCSNCHREIHYTNTYSNDFLFKKQYFDENLAQQLIFQTKEKEYYCTNCHTKLSGKTLTGLCDACYRKSTRKVKRPEREELKNLIRTIPFTTIAEQFGVTDNAIRKWCKAENLPFRKTDIANFSDEEWEKI